MSIAGTFMATWDLKSIGSTFMAAGIGSVAGQIYLDRRKQKNAAKALNRVYFEKRSFSSSGSR
jgi:hypothetical protein